MTVGAGRIRRIILIFTLILLCGLSAVCFTGCSAEQQAWHAVDNNEINIALIGDEEFFRYGGAYDAMEYAADEFSGRTGVKVNLKLFNDNGDYNTGVALASEIAEDDSISVTISKQELDIIDTVASIFNANKKPLIVTNGCYDRTSAQGYSYLITDFINADTTGRYMGKYAVDEGYRTIAYCHSDTEYEKDELKGVQSFIKNTGTKIVDTVIGPFTQEEFDECYDRWCSLDVDAVYISIYEYLCGSDIIRMLREKGSDIPVMTDYAMENDYDIEINGEYMDGTVILPLYPFEKNDMYNKIYNGFKARYRYGASASVMQSYELVSMICGYLNSGIKTSSEFMDCMKSEDGYETTAGVIHFDANGVLVTENVWYMKFEDGAFDLFRNAQIEKGEGE